MNELEKALVKLAEVQTKKRKPSALYLKKLKEGKIKSYKPTKETQ